jgi:hypothetical protein
MKLSGNHQRNFSAQSKLDINNISVKKTSASLQDRELTKMINNLDYELAEVDVEP